MNNDNFSFRIEAKSGELARAGRISTPHGEILTPTFLPVGTLGEVKFLSPEILRKIGTQGMLANGYHLLRRATRIDQAGGLARWNGWNGPTMTDSGGFQVMSLGSGLGKIVSMAKKDAMMAERLTRKDERLANVDDEGVEFRDPWSGRIIKFTPEISIMTQHKIGADIIMSFDELTNISDSYEYNVAALERTQKWAARGLAEHIRQTNSRSGKNYQALYGALQGAHYQDLREKAARDLAAMEIDGTKFDGFGLGGAFEKENLAQIIAWMTRILPEEKPRHLLGLAHPDDIFAGVANGADTFDCVAPTREARHGRIYTFSGNLNLKKAEFAQDERPLDPNCDCPFCEENFARSFVRNLLKSREIDEKSQAMTILSAHNVRFIVRLTEEIRASIIAGNFLEFRADWLARWKNK